VNTGVLGVIRVCVGSGARGFGVGWVRGGTGVHLNGKTHGWGAYYVCAVRTLGQGFKTFACPKVVMV